MPCLRHRSLADIPAACSFKTLMICSSVNLPLRIVCLLGGEQNPNSKPGAFQGSRSTVLADRSARSLLIVGHTDSVGTEKYNAILSLNRAVAVAAKLREAGINDKLLAV